MALRSTALTQARIVNLVRFKTWPIQSKATVKSRRVPFTGDVARLIASAARVIRPLVPSVVHFKFSEAGASDRAFATLSIPVTGEDARGFRTELRMELEPDDVPAFVTHMVLSGASYSMTRLDKKLSGLLNAPFSDVSGASVARKAAAESVLLAPSLSGPLPELPAWKRPLGRRKGGAR